MTSELVVGVVFGRPVEGKTTLSYICLPFHSPTQASQLTGTSSYYRFRCHYPLITYLNLETTIGEKIVSLFHLVSAQNLSNSNFKTPYYNLHSIVFFNRRFKFNFVLIFSELALTGNFHFLSRFFFVLVSDFRQQNWDGWRFRVFIYKCSAR